MYPLEGDRLLEAWDRACTLDEMNRAPQLLAVACPPTTALEWCAASILELNLNLLRLRKITFGPQLNGYLPCPSCNTRLEFGFNICQAIESLESLTNHTTAKFALAGDDFSMRRLSTLDLVSIRGEINPHKAQLTLLNRCLSNTGDAPAFDFQAVPEESEGVAIQIFSQLNEGAEIICQASCMECGGAHRFDLDIARFLWSELRHGALNLMREVDELATAYGWSEQAILAMSPQRRRHYTEMIRA